jgi:thiol-disulfide isomerase/thioredoxin
MKQRTLVIISVVILVAIVAGAFIYSRLNHQQLQNASTAPVNASASLGQDAPTFAVPTTAGPFDLTTVTKPVFLEIFATWCPHCQRETVVLNQLFAAYGKRVQFIAVPGSDTGMDGSSPESQFDVLNFQIRFAVKYPIAAYDPNLTVAKQYLKGGYPTIAVIGTDKKIAYINSGEIPFKELAAVLDKVLKK